MQNKAFWIGMGVVIALLIAGFAFLGRGRRETPQATPTQVPETLTPEAEVESTSEDGEVQEITLEADEYFYSQKSITVKKGQRIKLTLVNKGRMSHDFVVERMNVTTELAGPGETVTTEFIMHDAGTYTFYCSIGNHRALGMEGTLIVEE
jgi:plastocyanin